MEAEGQMTLDEFYRLFCKGVLKKALIDVAEKFDNEMKKKGGDVDALPVGRKIDQYSRS